MQEITKYITENYLEVTAAIFGLIYVLLAARQNFFCWMAGIANVLIFAWIFFNSKIYANMSLQIIYLIISIYGLYVWMSKKPNVAVKISKMDNSYRLLMVVFISILTAISYLILSNTNSTTLFVDSFTAAAGLIATWMQARKYIENWLIFIPTDIILTIMFYTQELYVTSALFAIYTLIAIGAYFNWLKMYKKEQAN
ncbi:MAG: nicotinamide riboside transporter PnuC [Bacteroidales bacterium]|jgi:nicotinamide mononucleotide transporter